MSRIEALDQKLGEDPPDRYPNAGNDQEVPPSLEVGVGGVEEPWLVKKNTTLKYNHCEIKICSILNINT